MTPTLGGFAALATALAVALAGCGSAEPGEGAPGKPASAEWQTLPAAPLSPRDGALGLWTGSEVIVVGGNTQPCPPNASCVPPSVPPLADGAAYSPGTATWRRIADAPVPIEWAATVRLGSTAYLWVPGSPGRPGAPRAFLSYRLEDDRWDELPLPEGDLDRHGRIVAAGDRIVAYSSSDEGGERPDFVFDPAAGAWSELPPDPHSPAFDRWMESSGGELFLFDHELVPNPGSEEPALTRAAALDLETGTWRRLPDSEMLSTGPWAEAGDLLVNPTLGSADGGEVNGWGRSYPQGGTLDPGSGEWSALVDPPEGEEELAVGVLTASGGRYDAYRGWVLDATTMTWLELPQLDGGDVTGRTVVAAGDDLFVFGGTDWGSSSEGRLSADAYLCSPRG